MNGTFSKTAMESLGTSTQMPVDAARDNRREIRLPCNTFNVKVCFEGYKPGVAWLVEVSRSGLGLVMYDPAPVRVLVRVFIGDLIVEGEIRHCGPRADNRSYTVGVSIRSLSGDSKVLTTDPAEVGFPQVLTRRYRISLIEKNLLKAAADVCGKNISSKNV